MCESPEGEPLKRHIIKYLNLSLCQEMTTLEKLNFLVKYMWKVFGYSFYSGVRCEDERSVALKCYRYERSDIECATPRSEF